MCKSKKQIFFVLLVIVGLILHNNAATFAQVIERKQYVVNSITIKDVSTGQALSSIPGQAFDGDVSISSKTETSTVYVCMAAYTKEGQLIEIKTTEKRIAARQTDTCKFSFQNESGNIDALKVFVLDSSANLVPIAEPFTFSETDSVVYAYFDATNRLIVRLQTGIEINLGILGKKSFDDCEIGEIFPIYPNEEFDWPIIVTKGPHEGEEFNVHVNSMYYQLMAKNDIYDAEKRYLVDAAGEKRYEYIPNEVMVFIEAETDPCLAGSAITFFIRSEGSTYVFNGTVGTDGEIYIEHKQYPNEEGNYTPWTAPPTLAFYGISVEYRCLEHRYSDDGGTFHVCEICGFEGTHTFENSQCTVCGYNCTHSRFDKENEVFHICRYCGLEEEHQFDEYGRCDICHMHKEV